MASRTSSEARRRALSHVVVSWDGSRKARVVDALRHRIEAAGGRRRRIGVLLAAAVVPVLLVALAWFPWGSGEPLGAGVQADAPSTTGERIGLGDGSVVHLARADSQVQVRSVSDSRIDVELRRGRARFEVTRRPERTFAVHAGSVTVQVIGTRFAVELRGAQTLVEVEEGLVSVRWEGGDARLATGQSGVFPAAPRVPPAEPRSPPSTSPAVAPSAVGSGGAGETLGPRAQLRALAESKAYAQAYQLMKESPEAVGSGATDLMLAADVARSSGHPGEAIPYLRRVVQEHPGSGQAPLAAFTLGRILSGMGRTAEATEAFATVSRLAPGSALAEDALARRVEAASAAGDRATARRLAEQYLSAHPSGRRASAMRRLGGLDRTDAAVE